MAENAVAFDTETHLVQPGLAAPPLVCGSLAVLNAEVLEALQHATALECAGDHQGSAELRMLYEGQSPIEGMLLAKEECLERFRNMLNSAAAVITGANIAYDILVVANACAQRGIDIIPQLFATLDEGRVYDLLIVEALDAIANGHLNVDPRTGRPLVNPATGRRASYSLSMCVDLLLGRKDAKANDEWRLRYAELEHVPLTDWPQAARVYPVDDACNTLEAALAQCGVLFKTTPMHQWGPDSCLDCGATSAGTLCVTKRRHRNLQDLACQVRAALALHLGAAWGFHVDQSKVDVIEKYAQEKRARGITPFQEAGVVRPEGSVKESVLKAKIAQAYGSCAPCRVCSGSGKIPSPRPRMLRCTDCNGRSAPWKWGGTLRQPTRGPCSACNSLGRVPDPRHLITCTGSDGDKTCDGTGVTLTGAVPRSETGCISTSADTLHESGDDFLTAYGDFTEDAKWLKDYVPFLRRGRVQRETGEWVDIPLTLKPDSLKVTGRVSYRDHIGTFPRWPGFFDRKSGQYIPSFRECIVARPNMVLSSEDFRAGELVTGAQSSKWLVGFSDLGTTLLSRDADGNPMDCHSQLAARIIRVDYTEFARNRKKKKFTDLRNASKPFLFGKPGGMGDPKIVLEQRRHGPDTPHATGPTLVDDGNGNLVPGYVGLRFCLLMGGEGPCGREKIYEWRERIIPPTCRECVDRAVELGQHWRSTFREYNPYFKFVTRCVETGQVVSREMLERWPHLQEWFRSGEQLAPGEIMQHVSGRVRGGMDFKSAANGFFQGLLADIAKTAYWLVTCECYDKTRRVTSMLYANSIPSRYAGGPSPLWGSRSIGFFHDELLNEHPASVASDASKRVSEIMRDVMRWYCPDYADAAEAEPTLMLAWDKRATKIEHRGEIQIWTPTHDPKKCNECQTTLTN